MAVQSEGTFFPVPTGAVDEPPAEVTYEQPADPSSTGAQDELPDVVTTKFGPSGQKPTGTVEVPETVSYTNPVVKVINPPAQDSAEGETTAETEGRRSRRNSDDNTGGGGN